MSVGTVARPKKKPVGPRPTALTIKGNLEWRAWLEEAAQYCRTDVAKLVDVAVAEYVKAKGFTKNPPVR